MSYLDQGMTPTRIWAMVIVALLHVLLGFAFVTGFAQKYIEKATQDMEVFDVEEPPPPEEEPPPPEEEPAAPEVVMPEPIVRSTPPPTPQVRTVTEQPPVRYTPLPAPPRPAPPAPLPPPPPPPPPPPASPPSPARLRSGSISDADYPAAAIRAEAQGTTVISMQVGANGRVTGCSVSSSSGNGSLDSTACSLAQRRFRFTPATRNGQPVATSVSQRIVWRLPRE